MFDCVLAITSWAFYLPLNAFHPNVWRTSTLALNRGQQLNVKASLCEKHHRSIFVRLQYHTVRRYFSLFHDR